MAKREQSPLVAPANLSDNVCKWKPGTAGHYEVWFLTLNERKTGRGFWFRYGLQIPNPSNSHVDAHASLWATVFDRHAPDKNFGLIRQYNLEDFNADQSKSFVVRVGESLLSTSRATGAISGKTRGIAWDLEFKPNERTHHHLTPRLSGILRPTSVLCSPNLDTRFSGTINVDGFETRLVDEPGCQSHLWGRKRVDYWVWVHSNAFEGHSTTVFEGLAASAGTPGRMSPTIQSLFLRHRDEEHRFLRFRIRSQWRRDHGIGYWTFSAMNTRLYIEGTAQCRLRDMLQVEYQDPDGEALFCVNSEVANLKIRLFRRAHGIQFRHVETLAAHSTAHLEHACRTAQPGIQFTHETIIGSRPITES